MVKSDSPIFKDKVGKKNMFTAAAEFLFFQTKKKIHFATKPLTKSKEREFFFKANKTQKQGSRQAKIIPPNSAVAKKGGKPNYQNSLEKTFIKISESYD